MFKVTMAARARLSHKLTLKKAAQEVALRFTRREGGWSLRLDRPQSSDLTFAHNGRPVLLLDRSASAALATRTLDIRTTDAGPRLTLK